MSETTSSDSSTKHHRSRRPRSVLSVIALVAAVIALALSGWAVIRSMPDDSYTDVERAEAKGRICAAADLVRKGVSLNTNLQPAGGPEDVTGSLAVAANARVALYDGGQYLLSRLDPATPPELADSVRKFANTLTDIGAAATAGVQNTAPDQAARLRDADSVNATIMEMCK
ncbi:MAG TPA: hypothetical protein VHI10_17155 [Mycobacterium sp.]|nr:hypothetical protein [Mycobacterium sp.]